MRVIYWLAIFIVLLIIEIATMGLTTIWFAGGALIAFCAGLVGFGLGVQIGVFVIVSILLLILTRPIAVKFFNQERQKTNAESLIGQHALVTEDIDTIKAKGRAVLSGNSQKKADSGIRYQCSYTRRCGVWGKSDRKGQRCDSWQTGRICSCRSLRG